MIGWLLHIHSKSLLLHNFMKLSQVPTRWVSKQAVVTEASHELKSSHDSDASEGLCGRSKEFHKLATLNQKTKLDM